MKRFQPLMRVFDTHLLNKNISSFLRVLLGKMIKPAHLRSIAVDKVGSGEYKIKFNSLCPFSSVLISLNYLLILVAIPPDC